MTRLDDMRRLVHATSVATDMKKTADAGVFDGLPSAAAVLYLRRCRVIDTETRTLLIYSREVRNPTVRWPLNLTHCYHLVTGPAPSAAPAPLDPEVRRLWLKVFFGPSEAAVWHEAAKTGHRFTEHWRLFCDSAWTPLLAIECEEPALDELGWQSAEQAIQERDSSP